MHELSRISVETFRNAPKTPVALVLDNIRSLHNVGAAFRTADAFLLQEVLLCGITGTPPHKEIERAALGATESVAWRYFSSTADAVRTLKTEGYTLVAVEQVHGATPLQKFQSASNKPMALIFGNELFGVEEDVLKECDAAIEIPQFGTKHSLNVSVSIGIVLWELLRHQTLKTDHGQTQ